MIPNASGSSLFYKDTLKYLHPVVETVQWTRKYQNHVVYCTTVTDSLHNMWQHLKMLEHSGSAFGLKKKKQN